MDKKSFNLIIITLILTALLCTSLFYSNKIIGMYGYTKAAYSYYGSTGQEVIDIQARLYNWGYYGGIVDGIYGYKTYKAIIYFQEKNGLRIDGIAGAETLEALGLPTGEAATSYSSSADSNYDLHLLAHLIYGEARGEPYTGQVAVGAVIMNRVRDNRFPKTIAGVIYQPGAFDAVYDGQINLEPGKTAINAASDAMNGWDPSGGAIYYYNPATATSKWIWTRPIVAVIGRHNFAI